MTNLIDIYEAAGAAVNEDRTAVTLTSEKPLKPFEIVLTVFPHMIEQDGYGNEKITLAILLDDTHFIHSDGRYEIFSYEEAVTLPVPQVRIHKEEKSE